MPPVKLDFSHLPVEALAIKRVHGRAPDNTNIKYLGITKDSVALLTPAAAKLTKADLVSLQNDLAGNQKKLGLHVEDINSIKTSFSNPIDFGGGHVPGGFNPAADITCCCCTPCCCAAAVPVIMAVR